MSRRLFIGLFVALAICFVPVILYFGIVVTIIPTSAMIVGFFSELRRYEFPETIIILITILIFTAIFYGIAHSCHWLSCKATVGKIRTGIQVVMLLGVFSTSFLRVLHHEHLAGRSGTYTFWGAVHRYFERYNPAETTR